MKEILIISIPILIISLLISCSAGINEHTGMPNDDEELAGFWYGLCQGCTSPITFVISLFSDCVCAYEVHNNGGWYNFGFLIGAAIICGSCVRRVFLVLRNRSLATTLPVTCTQETYRLATDH